MSRKNKQEKTLDKLTQRQRMQIRIRRLKKLPWQVSLSIIPVLFILFLVVAAVGGKSKEVKAPAFDDGQLTMDFVGDIMLGRNIKTIGEKKGYSTIFDGVSSYWKQADFVCANLESAVLKSLPSDYEKQKKNIHLYCDYNGLEAAMDAGINVFACANNHAWDYSDKAVKELIGWFQDENVIYSGIGVDTEDMATYRIIEHNGIDIAFISITDVFYNRDVTENVLTTAYGAYNLLVYEASQLADLTVVYIHWGEENQISSNDEQRSLGHQFITAGADIVIGSHPHVVQEVEVYRDGIIFYSLGNFIFDQGNTYANDSVMVRYSMDKDGKGMFLVIPIRLNDGIPGETRNAFYRMRIYNEITQGLNKNQYYYDEDGYLMIPATTVEIGANDDKINATEEPVIPTGETMEIIEETTGIE